MYNDKEKIIKQTGPLPEKVVGKVDSMSGVGALWIEKGRMEGRNKALYYDAGFTIEEIVRKTNKSEEEIKETLSFSDEE